MENSSTHKSKEGDEGGSKVFFGNGSLWVRKCEVYVWVHGCWCGVEEAGVRGGWLSMPLDTPEVGRILVSRIQMNWLKVAVIH